MLPNSKAIGRPREVELRKIINGIFYVLREGCTWRALPHDLPAWQTVYNYFRHWQRGACQLCTVSQNRSGSRQSMVATATPMTPEQEQALKSHLKAIAQIGGVIELWKRH